MKTCGEGVLFWSASITETLYMAHGSETGAIDAPYQR